jgi:4-diphosphocytidyl-2-C-methyl-D-erythritol kinase
MQFSQIFYIYKKIVKNMIVFPNSKINLGLKVIHKRPDGFHNIETVFYPIDWCDSLEIIENKTTKSLFSFSQSGLTIDAPINENIIYKAWKLLLENKKIPPISVHLHKNIPMGAGLGGGSADAAFFINALNLQFDLKLTPNKIVTIANKLGSDCAFFINNVPVIGKEKGNVFSEINVNLSAYYILIVYPAIHSNTKDAYEGLKIKKSTVSLKTIIVKNKIDTWKTSLINDFEETLFLKYPRLKKIKENLYSHGATYASMSGSGSSVYGIFEKKPTIKFPKNYLLFLQSPSSAIL